LAGTRFDPAGQSFGTTLLLVASVVGLGALTVAARVTLQLSMVATRAVRGGFAWLTVLETLADPHADTGNVIAGAGEFAGLTAEVRSRLRTFRVVRAVALVLGSALSLPTLVLIVVLGSAGVGPNAAWLALLPPIAALLVAGRLRGIEKRLASPQSRETKRHGPEQDLTRLSHAWYESFESARHGQRMGRGPVGRPGVGRGIAWAVVVPTVAGGVAVTLLVTVGAIGPSLWQGVAKVHGTHHRAEVARPFGILKDSSITPLQAGRAFAALNPDPPDGVFPPLPRPQLGPMPWHNPLPPGSFPTAQSLHFLGPNHLTILEAATRGFSPAEMNYLERLAHADVWPFFATVARAPAVDLLGGRFKIPFPDSANSFDLPVMRFAGTKELAYAAASRAAWFLARGQRDSAETSLREVISFGFALKDGGSTSIDALVGGVIVGIGRSNLDQLYTLTGNRLGNRLRARWDSATTVAEEVAAVAARADEAGSRPPASTEALRSQVLDAAGDARNTRSIRMEMLGALGMSPCTNLRELVFGPNTDVEDVFADARKRLARFASDSALIDMLLVGPERVRFINLDWATPGLAQRMVMGASDVTGAVLANRRLPGCARLLLFFRPGIT